MNSTLFLDPKIPTKFGGGLLMFHSCFFFIMFVLFCATFASLPASSRRKQRHPPSQAPGLLVFIHLLHHRQQVHRCQPSEHWHCDVENSKSCGHRSLLGAPEPRKKLKVTEKWLKSDFRGSPELIPKVTPKVTFRSEKVTFASPWGSKCHFWGHFRGHF